jgi:hypothetical protein
MFMNGIQIASNKIQRKGPLVAWVPAQGVRENIPVHDQSLWPLWSGQPPSGSGNISTGLIGWS